MTAAAQIPLFADRRRHPRRRFPPALERRTHIALADLLRWAAAPGWIFLHIPNGEYRAPATAALLARMGVLPGAFDFLLISPAGEHHWLELKRGPRATMSIAQIRFRVDLQTRGVSYCVARSFDEAVTWLAELGALRAGVRIA